MEINQIASVNKTSTVLVVEDSGMNQMLLEVMLERLQQNVLIAYDGQEALEILQKTPVDLVLSDIHMPEMDGFELLERIRSVRSLNHIPVILMTAGGKLSLSDEARMRGANGFLTYPFSSIELKQVIAPYIQRVDVQTRLEL